MSRARIDAAYARLLADIAAAESGDEASRFHPEALGTCTVTAAAIAADLRAAVYGYAAENNPDAELGQLEGGHDFALVENRYIVDWWATAYPALAGHPGVIDTVDPAWAERVLRWYGPRQRWSKLGFMHEAA